MLLPLNSLPLWMTRTSAWNCRASLTNLSAGRMCKPSGLAISTWRRATGGSWLIGGSGGLGPRGTGRRGGSGQRTAEAVRRELPADLVFATHVLLGGPVAAAAGAPYGVKAHG